MNRVNFRNDFGHDDRPINIVVVIIIIILPSVAYDPEGWQKLDRLHNTTTPKGQLNSPVLYL